MAGGERGARGQRTARIAARLAYALALAVVGGACLYGLHLLRRAFVADKFIIPSDSMRPTLVPGDEVWVNKLLMGARIYTDFHFNKHGVQLQSFRTRGLRPITYNDIVVFNRANHGGTIKFIINYVYCKRVVGLPGDSVSIVDGHYRNNNYGGQLGLEAMQRRLQATTDSLLRRRRLLRSLPRNPHVRWTIRNFGPMYVPRKGDVMAVTPKSATIYKTILKWETGKDIDVDWEAGKVTADGKPFRRHRFSHNYYFVAGDNVLNSDDSRYFGPVPEEYIVGIVGKVIKN